MSPNVMSGCEWIHSIASAVVNHNAAAAPPMSEDGHCKDGCREYTCSCVGSKNTKILYLIIFSSRLSFRLSWTWIPKYGLCALSIAVNSEIQASLRKKALRRCVGFTRVTHMNRICCKQYYCIALPYHCNLLLCTFLHILLFKPVYNCLIAIQTGWCSRWFFKRFHMFMLENLLSIVFSTRATRK